MTKFAIETVEGAPRARRKCCVAIDAGGSPHIAYATEAGHVAIASRSGSWAIEQVFGSGILRPEIEERVWLAIGADGNPQIAFIGGEGTLVHGARRDGAWTFSQVPTNQFNEPGGVTGFGFRLHPRRITPELRDTPLHGGRPLDGLAHLRPSSELTVCRRPCHA